VLWGAAAASATVFACSASKNALVAGNALAWASALQRVCVVVSEQLSPLRYDDVMDASLRGMAQGLDSSLRGAAITMDSSFHALKCGLDSSFHSLKKNLDSSLSGLASGMDDTLRGMRGLPVKSKPRRPKPHSHPFGEVLVENARDRSMESLAGKLLLGQHLYYISCMLVVLGAEAQGFGMEWHFALFYLGHLWNAVDGLSSFFSAYFLFREFQRKRFGLEFDSGRASEHTYSLFVNGTMLLLALVSLGLKRPYASVDFALFALSMFYGTFEPTKMLLQRPCGNNAAGEKSATPNGEHGKTPKGEEGKNQDIEAAGEAASVKGLGKASRARAASHPVASIAVLADVSKTHFDFGRHRVAKHEATPVDGDATPVNALDVVLE